MILLTDRPVVQAPNLQPTLLSRSTLSNQSVLYCRCVAATPGGEGAAGGPVVRQEDEAGHVSATAHVRTGGTGGKITSGKTGVWR